MKLYYCHDRWCFLIWKPNSFLLNNLIKTYALYKLILIFTNNLFFESKNNSCICEKYQYHHYLNMFIFCVLVEKSGTYSWITFPNMLVKYVIRVLSSVIGSYFWSKKFTGKNTETLPTTWANFSRQNFFSIILSAWSVD